MPGLPKWPQMYTTGKPVTPEQSKEIIRRTDRFFSWLGGGNDHEWDETVRGRLYMPFKRFMDLDGDSIRKVMELTDAWMEHWGYIHTEYVHNSWISCAFIGGPHGWCHPYGHIGFTDNVGKWPSEEAILEDWKLISKEFPFVDVSVSLMGGEDVEETKEIIQRIRVLDGDACFTDDESIHEQHPDPIPGTSRSLDERLMDVAYLSPRLREHGVPEWWIDEWAEHAEKLFG